MDIIYFTNDRIEFTDGHPSQGITKREMDAEVPEIVAAFRRKTTMYNIVVYETATLCVQVYIYIEM